MKLNDKYISKKVNSDYILVSVGDSSFNGIVNANVSAGFIIDCLKTDTTRQSIIDKMAQVYDAPIEVLAEDVDKVLGALRGINAIDE